MGDRIGRDVMRIPAHMRLKKSKGGNRLCRLRAEKGVLQKQSERVSKALAEEEKKAKERQDAKTAKIEARRQKALERTNRQFDREKEKVTGAKCSAKPSSKKVAKKAAKKAGKKAAKAGKKKAGKKAAKAGKKAAGKRAAGKKSARKASEPQAAPSIAIAIVEPVQQTLPGAEPVATKRKRKKAA